MLVRDKVTGQIGNLPDADLAKFSSRYEPADQSNLQPEQPAAKSGGFVENLIKSLVDPFVKTGQTLVGAGVQTPLMLAQANAIKGGDTTKAEKLSNLVKALGNAGIGLSEKSFEQAGSDPLKFVLQKGVQPGVGVASYGIPIGGATKLAGKTIAPGVLGGGALAGGMFSASQEDASPTSIATGAVTGLATAGILDKVLGKSGLGKTLREVEQGGQKRLLGVSKTGPRAFNQEEEFLQSIKSIQDEFVPKLGKEAELLNKSGEAVKKASSKITEQLDAEVLEKAAKINKPIASGKFATQIKNSANSVSEFDRFNPVEMNNLQAEVRRIIEKYSKNGEISQSALNTAKSDIAERMGNAWKKLSGTISGDLTPPQKALYAIWQGMDNLIDPSLRSLTRKQSIMHSLSEGTAAQLENGLFFPVLGRQNLAGRGAQAAVGKAYGLAGNTGKGIEALSKIPGLEKILPRAAVASGGVGESPSNVSSPGTEFQLPEDLQIKLPDNGIPGNITPEQVQQAMIEDLKTGGKNLTKLNTILSAVTPSAAKAKSIAAASSATTIYNQVAKLALTAPSGASGYLQSLVGLIPGVEGGSAEDLKRVTEGYAKAIAKAFAGENGVATDQDIQRWLGMMPKPGDTSAERVRTLKLLKQNIETEIGK